MKIVTDRFLSDQYVSGDSLFIKDLIAELAFRNPKQSFVMLANQKQTANANLPPNITIYRINSFLLKWIGKRWWYKYILPVTLKRLGAAVFLCVDNPDGPLVQMPCCLFLTTLPADFDMDRYKDTRRGKRLLAACRRSRVVVTFSGHDKHRLQQRYPAVSGKVKHLQVSKSNEIKIFNAVEKEAAKTRYANGLEYFAFAGDLHESHLLTELLKAFSIFKKWQRSNMQLVIAGNTTGWTENWLKSLDSYKYRHDVHVIPDPSKETRNTVIAGAYAFVYPALHDHLPVNMLYAMQAAVPVITSSVPVIKEIAGDAALYVTRNDETGFAASMQRVYKDELFRDSLVEKGSKQVEKSGHDIAEACWQMLEKLSDPNS